MSLINREALYEKACDLEAQALSALSYVGKIANVETKIEEWRIWSAILTERTAFKHDVFDAPDAKPERTGKWIHGRELAREMISDCIVAIRYDGWRCSECDYLVEQEREPLYKFCPNCGARMEQ